MDCKDLMVGDLVRFKENYPQKELQGKIAKVKGVRGRIDVRTQDGEYHESEHPDWLEPIPLTEDILEKNGFEYERNAGYIFDDYDGNVVIYDDYNNRLKILQNHDVSFNRECFSKVCVHYLQHALRLCEIRKEIEL